LALRAKYVALDSGIKLILMYKDSSKPNEVKIIPEFLKSWNDFKDKLFEYKNYFQIVAFLMTITALFLGIESNNLFLQRIQALLLFILVVVISFILLSSLTIYYKGKHTEIYYAFGMLFQAIGLLFLYNIFRYLFTNFKEELFYYLKFTGVPLIAIFTNLISIYFFKLIRKYKDIKGSQLESFFLIILDFNLVMKYISSDLDFIKTLQNLIRLEFTNILLVYIFFITLWQELRPFDERTKISALVETIILAILILLPMAMNYFIFPLIN